MISWAYAQIAEGAGAPTGRVRTGLAHRLIPHLVTEPVLDVARAAAWGRVSDNAARSALETLAAVDAIQRDTRTDRTRTLYVCRDLLDLVADPDPAQQPAGEPLLRVEATGQAPTQLCGQWLPKAGRACGLSAGHRGQHR